MGWRGIGKSGPSLYEQSGRPTRKVATTPVCSGSSGHKGSVEHEDPGADHDADVQLCELSLQEANPTGVPPDAAGGTSCRYSTWCWGPQSGTVGTDDEGPEEAEGDGALSRTHEGGGVAPPAEREGRQASRTRRTASTWCR